MKGAFERSIRHFKRNCRHCSCCVHFSSFQERIKLFLDIFVETACEIQASWWAFRMTDICELA